MQHMWGEHSEYGPFSAGDDGYPNAGEVVRHYRVLRKISARRFGELYGQALGEKPKTRIWVLTMERTNDVPTDITRRRAIAEILGIPYVLLGLSQSIVKRPLMTDTPNTPKLPKQETRYHQILQEHQQTLTLYFEGYYHRHGQTALENVALTTQQLATLIPQAPERSRLPGIALLSRYHQFGVMVAREQQNYQLAIHHADKSLEAAKDMQGVRLDSDLMSIALYRRGITSFEQEITRNARDKNLQDASSYVDAALSYAQHASSFAYGFVSLEWGLIHAYTAQTKREKMLVRKQLDDSYNHLPQQYRLQEDENFIRFTPEWYHITHAEALIALGEFTEALGELELAEELTPLTLPRRFAYIDALRAKAFMGLGEFREAIISAKDALNQSKTLHSEFNIARIAQVYRELRDYKPSNELAELGREIMRSHPYLI